MNKKLTFIKQTRKLIDANKLQEAVKKIFNYSYNEDVLAQEFSDYFINGEGLNELIEDENELISKININEELFYKWNVLVGGRIEVKELIIKDVEECFFQYQ